MKPGTIADELQGESQTSWSAPSAGATGSWMEFLHFATTPEFHHFSEPTSAWSTFQDQSERFRPPQEAAGPGLSSPEVLLASTAEQLSFHSSSKRIRPTRSPFRVPICPNSNDPTTLDQLELPGDPIYHPAMQLCNRNKVFTSFLPPTRSGRQLHGLGPIFLNQRSDLPSTKSKPPIRKALAFKVSSPTCSLQSAEDTLQLRPGQIFQISSTIPQFPVETLPQAFHSPATTKSGSLCTTMCPLTSTPTNGLPLDLAESKNINSLATFSARTIFRANRPRIPSSGATITNLSPNFSCSFNTNWRTRRTNPSEEHNLDDHSAWVGPSDLPIHLPDHNDEDYFANALCFAIPVVSKTTRASKYPVHTTFCLDINSNFSVFRNPDFLRNIRSTSQPISVQGVNGSSYTVTMVGDHPFLGRVLYDPAAHTNIIGAKTLRSQGFLLRLSPNNYTYTVVDRDNIVRGAFRLDRADGFYKTPGSSLKKPPAEYKKDRQAAASLLTVKSKVLSPDSSRSAPACSFAFLSSSEPVSCPSKSPRSVSASPDAPEPCSHLAAVSPQLPTCNLCSRRS